MITSIVQVRDNECLNQLPSELILASGCGKKRTSWFLIWKMWRCHAMNRMRKYRKSYVCEWCSFAFLTLPEFLSLYGFRWVLAIRHMSHEHWKWKRKRSMHFMFCSYVQSARNCDITNVLAHGCHCQSAGSPCWCGAKPRYTLPALKISPPGASSRPRPSENTVTEKDTNFCSKWVMAEVGSSERLMWVLIHPCGYPCPWSRPTFFSSC